MVSNLVKVISVISIHLLCNSISSVDSDFGIEINNDIKNAFPVTTLSPISNEQLKGLDPVVPTGPDVNPTIHPPATTTPVSTTSNSTISSTSSNSSPMTVTPTPPSSSAMPTAAPASTPSSPSSGGKDRHFDGPSFIGGIILAAGLTCIAFFGFKVYRARTERNYHTL